MNKLIDSIRQESIEGGFIKLDKKSGRYYEVGDFHARQKIIRAFKEANKRKDNSQKSCNDVEFTSSDQIQFESHKSSLQSSLKCSESETSLPEIPMLTPMSLTRSPTSSQFNRIDAPAIPTLNRSISKTKLCAYFSREILSPPPRPPLSQQKEPSLRTTTPMSSPPSLQPPAWLKTTSINSLAWSERNKNIPTSNSLDNGNGEFNPSDFHMKRCTLDLLESDGDSDCDPYLESFFNVSRRKSTLSVVSE